MKCWPTIYPKLFSIHMHQLLIYHEYRKNTYQSVQNPHFIHYFATESQSLSCHQRNRNISYQSLMYVFCTKQSNGHTSLSTALVIIIIIIIIINPLTKTVSAAEAHKRMHQPPPFSNSLEMMLCLDMCPYTMIASFSLLFT